SGSNVLLLDEPFSALDAITKLSMQEWLLRQWRKWKQSILFITHDVNEALFLSDRIFILVDNPVHRSEEVKVVLDRTRDVYDLDHPITCYFGSCGKNGQHYVYLAITNRNRS